MHLQPWGESMSDVDVITEATATRPEKEYMAFLAEGRFMIQRSRSSGRFVYYPRVAEPGTGATDLEWVEVSGRGVVHATTVNHPRPPAADYNVALIDLEEGVRMMSRVEGLPPAAVKIGMAVKARIARDGEVSIVVFDAA
ncbi:MAG: hypothetical protein JWQ11_3034 [Rhizobacter sp.]|nr:hypothetical protein [Rhizobacter sp.]